MSPEPSSTTPDEAWDGASRAEGASPFARMVGAIIILALVVITVWAVAGNEKTVGAWQLTTAVSAHHVLTERDLKLSVRPDDDAGFAQHGVGRMTVAALAAGHGLRSRDLGPDIAGRFGKDSVEIGVSPRGADAVAKTTRPGDAVEVRLERKSRRATISGIVLKVSRDQAGAFTMATRRRDGARYLRLATGSRVVVIRDVIGP